MENYQANSSPCEKKLTFTNTMTTAQLASRASNMTLRPTPLAVILRKYKRSKWLGKNLDLEV